MIRPDVVLWRAGIRAYEGGLKRRPVFGYWRDLMASQWWPKADLEKLQLDRLRRLLQHAETHSPWYRDEWKHRGLTSAMVTDLDAYLRWPVIDRETIRSHRLAMRDTTASSLIQKATGGSSGVPLQFDLDGDSNERRMAAWHRGYSWAGAEPGTRQWYLWGVPPASVGGWKHRKARLYDMLYRRSTESCFALAESELERLVASLARQRPDAIVAYTNAIYTFARMLEARGIVPYRPGSIVVGAEQLHPFQRTVIERVFRTQVYETYGSREFMLMGAECDRHTGLHQTTENLLIELLDDAGHPVAPGTEGMVTVTDLTNFGMPFIRYQNGDRAVQSISPCPCGRGLPMLARIAGRQLDVLVTPEGGRLPGEFFPHLLKEIATVQRFQVVQERPEAIELRLVAPGWSAADAEWIRAELAAVAPTLKLSIVEVPDIPLTPAGKLQVVVNRIGSPTREEA